MTEAILTVTETPDLRQSLARDWLATHTGAISRDWLAIAGDASFRRYFRVNVHGHSRILMDAPPDLEDSAPFVDIAARLRRAGLHAPQIHHADLAQGFLLLEDLGDELFRDLIDERSVDALFTQTFGALSEMVHTVSCAGLPEFDPATLLGELRWFTRYYLECEKGLRWDAARNRVWNQFCRTLAHSAAEQAQVFVHRDVHSCNLLRTAVNSPGIIDFQDAVRGPITYDFVSLVWDRYFTWPRDRIEGWMEQYRRLAAPDVGFDTWRRWCDLMGLQRNIKIVGRFALLKHEQDKDGYVELIPRFYQHVLEVLRLYPEFTAVTEQLADPACAP